MEDNGQEAADGYMSDIVEKLLTRMYDESWNEDGETTEFCAFYDNGCTIYPFRPMVCRTVGTISYVDDFCPRERNEGGNIDFFSGEPVREAIRAFQDLMMEYAAGKETDQNYDMVVYMPLGILAFLLENDQINELYLQTDPKFWQGADGWFNYRTYFTKRYGYSDEELTVVAKAAGLDIIFEDASDD
jgi:Fe-S-cluster containining protein